MENQNQQIGLYKAHVQGKNGKYYDNLYLRIGQGGYFQIVMRFFNSNVWRMLLANAVEVSAEELRK